MEEMILKIQQEFLQSRQTLQFIGFSLSQICVHLGYLWLKIFGYGYDVPNVDALTDHTSTVVHQKAT